MKQFICRKSYISSLLTFFFLRAFAKIVIPLRTEIHDKDLTMGI